MKTYKSITLSGLYFISALFLASCADSGDSSTTESASLQAISSAATPAPSVSSFRMLIMSDTQFPWRCEKSDPGGVDNKYCLAKVAKKVEENKKVCSDSGWIRFWYPSTPACIDLNNNSEMELIESKITNDFQVGIIKNEVNRGNEGKRPKVKGIIINGDLVNWGHSWQLDLFKEFMKKISIVPVYLGLGNHDIGNNINEGCYQDKCQYNMLSYMRGYLQSQKIIPDFSPYDNQGSTKGSLAYYFDVENFRFIQLNNYPTFEGKFNLYLPIGFKAGEVKLTSSMEFLKKTLRESTGKNVVLNMHNVYGSEDEIIEAIKDYPNVKAIFGGHVHKNSGKVGTFAPTPPTQNPEVPVYLSGSSSTNKMLSVEFTSLGDVKVTVIDGGFYDSGSYKFITQ